MARPNGRKRQLLLEDSPPPQQEEVTRRRIFKRFPWIEFAQTFEQFFRIEDDGESEYELFVGEDQSPDFTASGQPVAVSATLPFNWTPTPPGAGTLDLHCVVRKRNKWNLQSFNVFERVITINALATQEPDPVSAPFDVKVYDDVSGGIRAISKYVKTDDPTPADSWELYAKEGIDPVPGTDTPVFTGLMSFLGEEAFLNQLASGFTPGNVLHVIATAIRASDSQRRNSAVVQHTLAASLNIGQGFMFGGQAYEQR